MFRLRPGAAVSPCWPAAELQRPHFRVGLRLNPEVSTLVYCSELRSKLCEAAPVPLRTSEELRPERRKRVKEKRGGGGEEGGGELW